MMIRTSDPAQVRAWLTLAKACDEVGDDHLPCRQAPDIFFANVGEWHLTKLAIEACNRCPLKAPCGEYAVKFNEPDGIWGGLSVGERKRLRRQMKSN